MNREQLMAVVLRLNDELKHLYGCDYSFVVVGQGKVIAASNQEHGLKLNMVLDDE